MSDINNQNKEYNAPPKGYQDQVFGQLPNQFVDQGADSNKIKFQIEEMLKGVRTSMPGIVQKAFEKDGALWVEVQPALSGKSRSGEDYMLPIVRAPLVKMNIAGFEIDYPDPVDGDEVAIMCSDRSIHTFIKEAGVGTPATVSILSLNNAWVIPVSFSNTKRSRKGDSDKFTITKSDSDGKVENSISFNADGVIINEGSNPTARKEDSVESTSEEDSAFWAFWDAMFAVIKGTPITEPGNGSPSAFQAALITALTASTPDSLTGKITDGSDELLLPD